jgi:hypothetical protein
VRALIDVRGAIDSRLTIVPIARANSLARSAACRGPRSSDRMERTNSAGSVARSSKVSSSNCEGLGAAAGIHSIGTGGANSRVWSSSNVATSTPDTPSMSE